MNLRLRGCFFNCLYALALLVVSPWIVYRAVRTGRYRTGWREKLFGASPHTSPSPIRMGEGLRTKTIWLHAVSVGEVQLLRPLVAELKETFPEYQVCISSTTETGIKLARTAFKDCHVFFMPLDFTWAVANTLKQIKPSLLILIELEVWPNLIAACKRNNCPVVIVNGRLSESSYRGYRRLRWLLKTSFEQLDWVGAQDEDYLARFAAMGVSNSNLVVTGNLKFDGANSDRQHPEIQLRRMQLGLRNDDLVWVVGSTQAPEERYALETFQQLIQQFPQLRIIVVPRHPERFEEVAKWIEDCNVPWIRRTDSLDRQSSGWKILLGDTIGELRWWWGLADIAFVGGSFGDRGGQNMLEPAALGIPTAVGPNTKNFQDIMRLLREAGAIDELSSPASLVDWADSLLRSPTARTEQGERAKNVVSLHRGALRRTMQTIIAKLPAKP